MEILSAQENNIYYLGFVGSFDTTDVEVFQAHVEEAIDAQHFKVVLNLGQMTFINSTALGSLIRAQKRLNQYGGDLAVAELSGFAQSVFKTLGIDRKIRCYDSEADAVAYLDSVGADGIDVEGEHRISFRFEAPEQLSAAGPDARFATMKSISERGITFEWENLDDLDVDGMFPQGGALVIDFKLPLYHESHTFTARASVANVNVVAGSRVTVQARFDGLPDVERRAIQQFVRDLRYLKGELSDGEG